MKNISFIFLASITVLFFSCNNELKKSDNVFFKAQNLFPEKWLNDEDEGGKNLHEAHFLNDQLKRLRTGYESKYIKVTNLNNAKAMVDQLPNLIGEEFVTIVYNFIDTLSHARTDSKIMRELAEDEAAYRALTKSWFLHSPLLETIRYLSSKNVKIVLNITTKLH